MISKTVTKIHFSKEVFNNLYWYRSKSNHVRDHTAKSNEPCKNILVN